MKVVKVSDLMRFVLDEFEPGDGRVDMLRRVASLPKIDLPEVPPEWRDEEADVNDTPTVGPDKDAHVTRFEVIDEHGRAYTRYRGVRVQLSYQDGGRTLKVFVEPR